MFRRERERTKSVSENEVRANVVLLWWAAANIVMFSIIKKKTSY